LRDAIGQGRPFDQFHHERRHTGAALEPVNRGDMRVVQRGKHLGFALKAGEAIGIVRYCGGQHLDGDRALQVGISRAVDLAMPPAPIMAAIS
jgi:hypothetical protein